MTFRKCRKGLDARLDIAIFLGFRRGSLLAERPRDRFGSIRRDSAFTCKRFVRNVAQRDIIKMKTRIKRAHIYMYYNILPNLFNVSR